MPERKRDSEIKKKIDPGIHHKRHKKEKNKGKKCPVSTKKKKEKDIQPPGSGPRIAV